MSWYLSHDVEIVAFYPYTSCVQDRIIEVDRTREWDVIAHLLVDMAKAKDLRAKGTPDWATNMDNKIAFLVKTKSGHMLFIGWYDSSVSIGFAVVYENHLYDSYLSKNRRYRDSITNDGQISTCEW